MSSEVTTESGAAGLPKAVLTHPQGARAEVHLWGATLTAWHPAAGADNVFWLDPGNKYDDRGPIRGGNPLVFPWFGAHATKPDLPRHGFARITGARLLSDRTRSPGHGPLTALGASDSAASGDSVGVSLLLDFTGNEPRPSMTADPLPHCVVGLDVDLFADRLRVVFSVRNSGDKPLDAEMLLHPYFAVGSALTAKIVGLQGLTYLDKKDGGRKKTLTEEFQTLVPPPDNVFESRPPGELVLHRDPLPPLIVRRLTSGHTVIWNSGPAWMRGPETAPPFACVEPGRIFDSAIRALAPGAADGLGMELCLGKTTPAAGDGPA